MSTLLSVIIKTFDNLIKFNENNITIIFDNNNNIWFSLSDVFKSIGYINSNREIKRLTIEQTNIKTYKEIFDDLNTNTQLSLKKRKNIQPHMKMTNESGIYLILDKSNKPIAKAFKDALFTNILPEYRKTGDIKSNSNDKIKLKKLTKKLHLIQKEQSMKRLTTKKYTTYDNISGKGFIYVLKVKILKDGKEIKCYKIGYATNLNKRLETYKTGHPDIELVFQENVNVSKKQLEKCVLNLNLLKRLSSKNEILCHSSLEDIKNEIIDCKKLIAKYSS